MAKKIQTGNKAPKAIKRQTGSSTRPASIRPPGDADYWKRDRTLDFSQKKMIGFVCLGVAIIMCLLSLGVGINGDDDVQAQYSSDLPSFYTSFGSDTTCFTSGPEIKYYGGFFELITGTTNQLLGLDQSEPGYYQVRHIWNAIFGAIVIYFLALLTGQFLGFYGAVGSVIFMFFTLRFLGHSLFNPKDIPFATGYMISLYYIYQVIRYLPELKRSHLTGLAAGVMVCVGVRVGGVLVIAYLGLFLALVFLWRFGFSSIFTKTSIPYLKAFVIPSVLGFLGALLFWPYGLIDPLTNVSKAFKAFSDFQVAIKVLFDGGTVWSSEIPFRYLLTWMGISIPLFTMAGLVLLIVFLKGILSKYNPLMIIFCFFAFAFPIVYVLAVGSILYDGWRHFLFTYAPLVLLSVTGWNYLYEKFQSHRNWKSYVWLGLPLLMLDSAVFLVRNSSYPYLYFNPLVGGIKGAYGYYELDYWGASVKQAIKKLETEGILSESMPDTLTIATNFSHAAEVYTRKYGDMVKINYVRWRQRYDRPWDIGIFVNRFVDGTYLRAGYWPTSKTIYTINANGVPVAIIERDSTDSDAYLGAAAIVRQDWDTAINYLEKETQKHPDNEIAWTNLGMAYLNKQQRVEDLQKAKIPLDKALAIVPENQNALNFMGYFYFTTGSLDLATTTFRKAAELHQSNGTAYYYLGQIDLGRNDYNGALDKAKTCINSSNLPQCYLLAAEAYRAMGDQANSQLFLEQYQKMASGSK